MELQHLLILLAGKFKNIECQFEKKGFTEIFSYKRCGNLIHLQNLHTTTLKKYI